MSFSNYLENKILDHSLGLTTYTKPAAVYLALFTSDPGETGSGTEVSTGGYARQAIVFSAASGGATSNTSSLTFTASGSGFGTVTHLAIYDAITGGNLLYYSSVGTPRTIAAGESLLLAAGDFDIQLD